MKLKEEYNTFSSAALPGRPMSARLISVIVISVLVVLSAAFLFVPIERKLTLTDKKTGETIYFTDVKPGDTYTVSYTHSINKSPVDDVLEIQKDYSIMLKKTVFRAFGVGIPSETEGGQTINVYDDRIEIDNINMPVKEHLVFVGVIADHTFTMHGQTLHLNELTQPQRTVQFEVRKVPMHILMRRD